jgi:tRNA-dihydrouridine synthase A
VRHIYGLFNGKPGARKFRQYLGENAPKTNNPAEMIRRAMDLVTEP